MSRVRREEQQLSGMWCHSLKEPDLCELLRQYYALLLGLRGPRGGTLLLQHSGGLDSFINSSSDLIKKIQPFHPCLKFINAVMEAQVSAYGSHGLYCGLLISALLRELLLLTQDVPQSILREVADGLANKVIAHCSEPISVLNLSNLHQMLSFLGTCLDSKALGLNASEKDHLRATVLEAFLMSVSESGDVRGFGEIAITIAPGRLPVEASAFKGVLYRHHRFQELSMARIIGKLESSRISYKMNAQTSEISPRERGVSSNVRPSEPPLKSISHNKMLTRYSHNIFSELHDSSIRLLLFNVMLEFTNTKTECVKYAGNMSCSSLFDLEVSKKLCRFIKQEGIRILACQKVVSESITFELERLGVLVLERLGTSLTASLEKLSSCRSLSDLSLLDTDLQPCSGTGHTHCSCPLMGTIGRVDSVQQLHLPGGQYLLIQNTASQLPVVTLLLPALCAHVAENLKVVVEQGLRSISQTALSPGLVCSRCWGASFAAVVQRQDVRAALLQETHATEAQVSLVRRG
ncbi:Chaperonin Cpn60/TCP-1 family [Trinorchestia longiramus]|nr:Chaperonin Cpn60/TCP-1 family [Trinorchestia longiramus]